jgi:hypothetical protein
MNQQIPRRKEGPDIPEVPPAEHPPEGEEWCPPMHDEDLGKPPRQPGQVDVRRVPSPSVQQVT